MKENKESWIKLHRTFFPFNMWFFDNCGECLICIRQIEEENQKIRFLKKF